MEGGALLGVHSLKGVIAAGEGDKETGETGTIPRITTASKETNWDGLDIPSQEKHQMKSVFGGNGGTITPGFIFQSNFLSSTKKITHDKIILSVKNWVQIFYKVKRPRRKQLKVDWIKIIESHLSFDCSMAKDIKGEILKRPSVIGAQACSWATDTSRDGKK